MKRRTTLINEIARKSLEISRDEYALCAYLLFRQGYPSQKVAGWCCDTKDELADFVGITRQGLYKMCNKLEALKLIEQSAVGGFLRATVLFIDSDNGVNKVDKASVNKVYIERKQSLQKVSTKFTSDVNKVDEVNNSKIKKEEKERERNAPAQNDFLPLEAETSKAPPVPEPPPAGPYIRDFVNADTVSEMVERIHAFYSTPVGEQEKEKIYQATIAGKMKPSERKDVVERFAAHAIEKGYGAGGKQYRDLNARFYTWWKDQSRFQQPSQGAPAHQNNRSEGPTLRSTDQNPYARHKIIS